MYCYKCRAELEEDAERCFNCGAVIDDGCGEESIAAFFEANEARVKEAKEINEGFLSTRFGKALFAFICFGIIAMSVSFGNGEIVSGVIAILMTVCAIISFFIGVRIIKVPSEEVKFLVAIIALMFVIPYFSAYNPVSERAGLADAAAVNDENTEQMEDTESVETFSVQEDETKKEAVVDEEKTEDVHEDTEEAESEAVGEVYVAPTGKKYHIEKKCAGVNAIPKSKAEVEGKYEPCKKCAK